MTKHKIIKTLKILAIVSPLLMFLLVTILSSLWTGYDFYEDYVSILGSRISPFRVVINVFGFGLYGLIMIALGYLLSATLRRNHTSVIATRLLMGSGVLLILLGIFPTDPDYSLITFEGRIHSILGKIIFIMLPLAMIWFGQAFKKDDDWGPFWSISSYILAAFALMTTLVINIFDSFDGFAQRLSMGADLLWMFMVSLNLFLIEKLKLYGNQKIYNR